MEGWFAVIRVWPFHGRTQDEVGDEFQLFPLRGASDFQSASNLALAVLAGIKTNPSVWEANIASIGMDRLKPPQPLSGRSGGKK